MIINHIFIILLKLMTANKRFLKEIQRLYLQQSQRELLENDYLIRYDEANINKLYAIIKAPHDSVYRHKFIRLDFTIPDNYPHSPPQVTFVNYDCVRIHPNMYENGKCCATILNTWGDNIFEKWTSSMGIETILLTFHSFLDNNPYMYEPGDRDDQSYTVYVLYQSWVSCLIRYLQNEKDETFINFIHTYMLTNIDEIFSDLRNSSVIYPYAYYNTRCFEIERFLVDYERLSLTLQNYYNYIDFTENFKSDDDTQISFNDFMNTEYDCCICYDTIEPNENAIEPNENAIEPNENAIELNGDRGNLFRLKNCKHLFHKNCLEKHIETNNRLCPMCRTELEENELVEQLNEIWMINPSTKRRIKIGGKTWNYLKNSGLI